MRSSFARRLDSRGNCYHSAVQDRSQRQRTAGSAARLCLRPQGETPCTPFGGLPRPAQGRPRRGGRAPARGVDVKPLPGDRSREAPRGPKTPKILKIAQNGHF